MKRVVLTLSLAAAAGLGLGACEESKFTDCYALFSTKADAEAAADELREAAPDLDIDLDTERRDREIAAIIGTSEIGEAARPLRSAFRRAVRAQGGQVGHPGDGCLEREPFM